MSEILKLVFKILWLVYVLASLLILAISRNIISFVIGLSISLILVFILYSLSMFLESVFKRKFDVFYLLLHLVTVMVLILLCIFIFKFHREGFWYLIWILASYPLILVTLYAVVYVYKTLSRK